MYLGIDIGTSGVKSLLIDAAQQPVAEAHASLEVARPHPGWSEQNPQDWIRAVAATLDALKASHPQALAAVRGIGLSGQMHGATLLDEADRVLRPCLLWNDTRSHAEAAELDADPEFRHIGGNIVFPGFTAPKVEWVRRQEPDCFKHLRRVLLPKDYVRLWLTGEAVSDMSDAAGTAWLDVAARDWSDVLLERCQLSRSAMPRLVEGSEASGALRAEHLARWGIAQAAIVAGGGGDNAASACGMGTVAPGSAFLSLGTSGVLFAANAEFNPRPELAVHAFCHALPGTWHQMGVMLSATDSLNWLANITSLSAADLSAELGTTLMPPGQAAFLPYLGGERTPHNDAEVRGAFSGLSHQVDRPALTRAVLEGVAFALRDNLDALAAAGTNFEEIVAIGGGSASRYWLELIATVFGVPLVLPVKGDFGAAFGAARLGLIAAEGADPLTVCTAPAMAERVEPVSEMRAAMDEAHERWRGMYPALRPQS